MGFQQPANRVNMIYGGDSSFNKRNQKLVWREILKMEPAVQKPLRHSEIPITFSREDQWTSFLSQENSCLFWTQWWQVPYLLEYLLMEAVA